MATKAIIGVDIDPEGHFKAFYDMFESFEEKLDKLPEGWKQVGDASKETTEAFAAITGALVENMATAASHAKDLGQYLHDAAAAQKEFGSASGKGAKHMKSMADDAKKLGQEIFGIGKFLFKLGAIGVGAVAGSLFGLDALANGAVANRQAARSLGLTTGQYRAFGNDLSTYVDESTLASVAVAQKDLTKQPWLTYATGMSKEAVQNTDAGTLAAQLALKAHDWFTNNPDTNDVQHFAATGFAQSGFDYESVRKQGNTSRAELERGLAAYQKDSRSLNYGAGAVDALYDFSNKLKLAGQHLETDLADKLSQLNKSGGLSTFITSLEKDAEILINGVLTPANMKSAQDGLTSLATYLGSPDFKTSVIAFAAGVNDMASAIGSFLQWVKPFLPTAPDPNAPKKHYLADGIDKAAADIGQDLLKSIPDDIDRWSGFGSAAMKLLRGGHSNNPGNLRSAPGAPTINGFAHFKTDEQGYAAMADLLQGYPTKKHADTLASIISTYAPKKDHNDDDAYIANVSKWTGFDPNQKLNLNDSVTLAKLMSAMVKQESGRRITPDEVQQEIAIGRGQPPLQDTQNQIKKALAAMDKQQSKPTQAKQEVASVHGQSPSTNSPDMKALMRQLARQTNNAARVTITNKTGNNVAVSTNAGAI